MKHNNLDEYLLFRAKLMSTVLTEPIENAIDKQFFDQLIKIKPTEKWARAISDAFLHYYLQKGKAT